MSEKDFSCTIEFLSDKPAKEDEFGPHERVAAAIAKVIDEQQEAGKAISLLGSWGSGKSSIIELLETKLREKKESGNSKHDNRVFLFDAWTHQNDLLRLSFLEAIITYLNEIEWINLKYWSEELEKLKQKSEETHVQENFFLSGWESLFIISVFLFPFGISLLNKYVDLSTLPNSLRLESISDIISSFQTAISILSIGIILLPLAILLIAYIDGENVVSLLLSKIRVERKSITLKSPEPTSLQFQKYFSKLMGHVLTEERRLTVVLDNLDRIGKTEALSLWSTMRMFFEFPTKVKPEWLDNFWLIVPMDDNAASRLWPQGETEESQPIAKAFVDKTFQIFFRVSPPVPTDWKNFFMKNLKKAIKHDRKIQELLDDFDEVYRLFQLKLALEEEILTPRAIKLFINKLATVHNQCCGEDIPMISQVLFVLYRENIDNIINNIGDIDFFGEKIWELYIKDNESVITGFVSLYLNLKKEEALQILVEPRIDASFENAEPTTVKDIADQHWFMDTCDRIITNKSNKWSWDKIVNAGYVLEKIRGENDFRIIYSRLANSLYRTKQIDSIDDKKGEGYSIILQNSDSKRSIIEHNTIESISNMVFKAESDGQPPNIAILEKWVKGVIIILSNIIEKNKITDLFRIPGKIPGTYLTILEILNNEGTIGRTLIASPMNLNDEAVLGLIGNIISSRSLDEQELVYIKIMLVTPLFDNWNWGLILEPIFNLFQAPNKNILKPKEIIAGICILNLLSKKGSSVTALNNVETRFSGLATDGHIFWHLNNLIKDKGDDFDYGLKAIGATLVPIIMYAENETKIKQEMREFWQEGYKRFRTIIDTFEGNPDNRKTLEYFTDFFLDFYSINELIEKINNIPSPIVKVSLEYIYEKEDRLSYYKPEVLVKIYRNDALNNFKRLFKEESKKGLIGCLVDNANLISELQRNNEFGVELVELYILVLETEKGRADTEFREFIANNLADIKKEEWKLLLKNQPEKEKTILDMLLTLIKDQTKLNPSTNLFNALEEYAASIIGGGLSLNENQIERTRRVPEALQDSDRNNFVRKLSEGIRDKIKIEEDYSIDVLFRLYGELMICQEVFSEDNHEFVRVTFSHIINRQSDVETDWLEDATEFLLHKTVKKNIREALITFVGQIRSRLSEQNIDPGIKDKLNRIYLKLERKYGRIKIKKS